MAAVAVLSTNGQSGGAVLSLMERSTYWSTIIPQSSSKARRIFRASPTGSSLEQSLLALSMQELTRFQSALAYALALTRATIGLSQRFTASAVRLNALPVIPKMLVTEAHHVFYWQRARKGGNSGADHAVRGGVRELARPGSHHKASFSSTSNMQSALERHE